MTQEHLKRQWAKAARKRGYSLSSPFQQMIQRMRAWSEVDQTQVLYITGDGAANRFELPLPAQRVEACGVFRSFSVICDGTICQLTPPPDTGELVSIYYLPSG